MKYLLLIFTLILPTLAQAGPYAALSGGLSHQKDYNLHQVRFTQHSGEALSGALGWEFGIPETPISFSLEAEYLTFTSPGDRIFSLDSTQSIPNHLNDRYNKFFINALIGVPLSADWTVYGGAGFSGPSYQFIGRLSYKLTDHWSLNAQYRYVHLDYKARSYDPKTGENGPMPPCCGVSSTIQTGGHAEDDGRPFDMLLLGIRYEF